MFYLAYQKLMMEGIFVIALEMSHTSVSDSITRYTVFQRIGFPVLITEPGIFQLLLKTEH